MYASQALPWELRGHRLWLLVPLTVAGALGNTFLFWFNHAINSPLFLDSIVTACIAVLSGPLAGMLTGALSNLIIDILTAQHGTMLVFAPCNIATGLVVGLVAHTGHINRFTGAIVATITVSLASTFIGAVINTFFTPPLTGHNLDNLVSGMAILSQNLFVANVLARIPVNLIDKGLAITLACLLLAAMRRKHEKLPVA